VVLRSEFVVVVVARVEGEVEPALALTSPSVELSLVSKSWFGQICHLYFPATFSPTLPYLVVPDQSPVPPLSSSSPTLVANTAPVSLHSSSPTPVPQQQSPEHTTPSTQPPAPPYSTPTTPATQHIPRDSHPGRMVSPTPSWT
jgi:hypothetical protein